MPGNEFGEWEFSKISGFFEPPKLHWLLDRLAELAPNAERELICKHAFEINFLAKPLAARFARRAYKIGAAGKNYFAIVKKAPGRAAGFQRLELAAKSGSLKRWLGAPE